MSDLDTIPYYVFYPPLKQTEKINLVQIFQGACTNIQASKVIHQLDKQRDMFISSLTNLNIESDEFMLTTQTYLSLLLGLTNAHSPQHPSDPDKPSLDKAISFTWSDVFFESVVVHSFKNVSFEIINILKCSMFWHARKAATICTSGPLNNQEQLKTHKLLKVAYQIALAIKEFALEKPQDFLHRNSLKINQAFTQHYAAEACEISLWRAIASKQSPSLVSKIASDIATKFNKAAAEYLDTETHVKTELAKPAAEREENDKLSQKNTLHVSIKYLQSKHELYSAVAYAFLSEHLVEKDKQSGAGIAAAETAKTHSTTAETYAHSFDINIKSIAAKSPVNFSKYALVNLAYRVGAIVDKSLQNAQSQNTLLYYQKVPAIPPALLDGQDILKDVQAYALPQVSALWQDSQVYSGFDLSKIQAFKN